MLKQKPPVIPEPQKIDAITLLWPRLMSIATAARYLDCSPWHVEEPCRSGSIRAFRENGTRWSIDRLELDRYVDRRLTEGPTTKRYEGANANVTEFAGTPTLAAAGSPYLTCREAADYAKAKKWTIGEAIRDGSLQAKKVGKRFVTTRKWIDDWFSARSNVG